MGSGCSDCDSSYVLTDGAGEKPLKTKAMVCNPGFILGKWGELSYKRQATGEGETFRERNKTRVSCTACGVTVVAYCLNPHMARSHGICVHQTRGVDGVGGGPATYVVYLPRLLQEVKCPTPG